MLLLEETDRLNRMVGSRVITRFEPLDKRLVQPDGIRS
jgi:hypothetical protein